jgi:hypothetical protein
MKNISGLGLAVIGKKHFGNPIPKEWYAAAQELIEEIERRSQKYEPIATVIEGQYDIDFEEIDGRMKFLRYGDEVFAKKY